MNTSIMKTNPSVFAKPTRFNYYLFANVGAILGVIIALNWCK